MSFTRIQALALAVGLILVGVAAAWAIPPSGRTPNEAVIDNDALVRGDLAVEPPAPSASNAEPAPQPNPQSNARLIAPVVPPARRT